MGNVTKGIFAIDTIFPWLCYEELFIKRKCSRKTLASTKFMLSIVEALSKRVLSRYIVAKTYKLNTSHPFPEYIG